MRSMARVVEPTFLYLPHENTQLQTSSTKVNAANAQCKYDKSRVGKPESQSLSTLYLKIALYPCGDYYTPLTLGRMQCYKSNIARIRFANVLVCKRHGAYKKIKESSSSSFCFSNSVTKILYSTACLAAAKTLHETNNRVNLLICCREWLEMSIFPTRRGSPRDCSIRGLEFKDFHPTGTGIVVKFPPR